jgi:hypothetical protein
MDFTGSLILVIARLRERTVSLADVSVGSRMVAWAVALRLLKHLVPLPRLARLMCQAGPPRDRDAASDQRLVALARVAAGLAGARADRSCLVRSLLAYRYLTTGGAPVHLVVGVERQEQGVRGHAWVAALGVPIGEAPEAVAAFEPILAFNERGEPYQATRGSRAGETVGIGTVREWGD